ncbi:helicase, UvrD/REP family protein [Marinobacter sp. ELB17]|nr:UvrD-helicase domain-containing protein [Marinobacter sp. ELB17]EAZ97233.1 helicase, UvrD/REP family protein [Marinobacter sp. ELB17]
MAAKRLSDLFTAPTFKPTAEQTAIGTAAATGRDLVVKAYAGTGKTATAVDTARSTGRRGRMILFNASARRDAESRMPPHIKVSTGHGMAHDHIVKTSVLYQRKLEYTMNCRGKAIPAKLIVQQFALEDRADLECTAGQIAGAALATLTAFLISDAPSPSIAHVPRKIVPLAMRLADDSARENELSGLLAELAGQIWGRMRNERDRFPLSHDGYVKILQLREIELSEDSELWIMDEYQDTNLVLDAIISHQAGQKIFIGDPYQQIYSWRGAVNAMKTRIEDGLLVMPLSQSFRFNHQIAGAANILLRSLGETVPLIGQNYNLQQMDLRRHHTVLVRNNVTMLSVAAEYQGTHQSVYVPGGLTAETRIKAESALALYQGRLDDVRVSALKSLGSWHAFEDAAKTMGHEFPEYRDLVSLILDHGKHLTGIIQHCAKPWDEVKNDRGRITLLTGHRAKGREWAYTRLTSDLSLSAAVVAKLNNKAALSEQEVESVNLLYVAITRCKKGITLPNAIKQNLLDLDGGRTDDIAGDTSKNTNQKERISEDEAKRRTQEFIAKHRVNKS